MGDIKAKYGAANQTISITLNSLASTTGTVGREGAAVDNSTNLFVDALVQVVLALPNSGTIGGDKMAYIYAYGSVDGANFSDTCSGTNAGITLTDPTQLVLIGTVSMPAINATYKSRVMSIAQAFGGSLPAKWGIVLINKSNVALASAGNSATYQGVLLQAA